MFRVLQFNMQFGMGWNTADPDSAPIDIEATIAEIRKHDPDIVLLQEVERALRRRFRATTAISPTPRPIPENFRLALDWPSSQRHPCPTPSE